MVSSNPLANPRSVPTKKDLENYLGPGRYHRFDTIYEELKETSLTVKMVWSKQDKQWHHSFSYKKQPVFSIRWGIDFFYVLLVLKSDDYLKLARNKDITPDAADLLRKYPPNPTSKTSRIEANMEIMRDQEAFFELLPVLLKELTQGA